jgi:hypothetical protein
MTDTEYYSVFMVIHDVLSGLFGAPQLHLLALPTAAREICSV